MIATQAALPEKIRSRLRGADSFIFDVDLTIIERHGSLAPGLATAMLACGKQLGIATSRAMQELDEIFIGSGVSRQELFQGPIIMEDGGVIIFPGSSEATISVDPDSVKMITEILNRINLNFSPLPGQAKWGNLLGLPNPLVHVPQHYGYKTSISVWQQTSSGAIADLDNTMRWFTAAVQELGYHGKIQLLEIGDGTLRISLPGISKGAALEDLHKDKRINLRSSVYFGDGRNDVPAAQAINAAGGTVIAVGNTCEELVKLSHHLCKPGGPTAVASILQSLTRL